MSAGRQVKYKSNGNTIFRFPVNFTTRIDPPGQTVTGAYYVAVQQQCFECNEKKTRNVKTKKWILHQRNVPAYTSYFVKKKNFFFAKN